MGELTMGRPFFTRPPDIQATRQLYRQLLNRVESRRGGTRPAGFEHLTGLREDLGHGSGPGLGNIAVFNTPRALDQMEWTLALTGHPKVSALVTPLQPGEPDFHATELVKLQILAGMRILDLGCGLEPTFARAARFLGAQVYTVDLFAATNFRHALERDGAFRLPETFAALERANHIERDLKTPAAVDAILAASGGNFDLVTSAHLDSGNLAFWNWIGPKRQVDLTRGVARSPAVFLMSRGGIDSILEVI